MGLSKYLISIAVIFHCISSISAQEIPVFSVPFNQVNIDDAFWSPLLKTHASATLSTCIVQMRDSTQRISNFEKAAGEKTGKHEGKYYDDSDVYKAMEGIAYSLINHPNPEYEALLDKWIDLIARSQQPDGYLNTYYTLNFPDQRWSDMTKHEMYCGGHMIEAAIAHYLVTGRSGFLEVAIKFANHIDHEFGPAKRSWVPGHQEIELALVKLYHITNEKRYLDLAHWFLEQRGQGHGVGKYWDKSGSGPAYCQDDVPVSELRNIKGHAVRAMYLFTGMAGVTAEKDFPEYMNALEHAWESVVNRNMYVTGGIGSSKSNEGFTQDYDLPNKTAYCETCASIGMVFWNNRMNLLSRDAKYADVMERSLCNGVLAGVSLDGGKFFYVNPLESDGNHHRKPWYGTACCPSNLARLIPSVGNYVYLAGKDEIIVNLYMGNKARINLENVNVNLIQKTRYPWEGTVEIGMFPSESARFSLKLRIPGWCRSYALTINGNESGLPLPEKGYLTINRIWKAGDLLLLRLDMPVEMAVADDRVKENKNKRAVHRGPLVYCIEDADNKNINFDQLFISGDTFFRTLQGEGKLSEMVILRTLVNSRELTFVPYFAWDNREPGKMKVWIDQAEQKSLYK